MRIGFICPDGRQVCFEECFAGCVMGERCLTKSTLAHLSRVRPWTGTPSTTQLINGTRLEYLKIVADYYVAPPRMAFALLGTKVHLGLADADTDVSLLEEQLDENAVSGRPDNYELEPGAEGGTLTDYKTWGSYKVARALGIVSEKVRDPTGAVYKRSGNGFKAGDPKTVTRFRRDPSTVDLREVELQLNHYRLMYEAAGFPVTTLQVEAIVRDGNTITATGRGVDREIYVIPVRILPNDEVHRFFDAKAKALKHAVETGTMPEPCAQDERWNGRRCAGYCDVWESCDLGRSAHQEAERKEATAA